jgi:hypothetical protein
MTSPLTWKHIYSKGSKAPDVSGIMQPNNAPGLYVSNDYTKLAVLMSTTKTPNHITIIDDIPVGLWMNVILSQEQHKLNIIINGILTKSIILNDIPYQNYESVYIGLNGGFNGYLSKLQYFAYTLGTKQIQSLINAGPDLTLNKNSPINFTNSDYLSLRWYFPNTPL